MKKTIITIAAMFAISTSIFAQDSTGDDEREKFQFGLKAGANYSNVYDSEGEDFDTDGKTGFAAGAFLAIPLGKFVGLQPEVLFSQKGFHGKGRILNGQYEFTRTSNFLDIPLFLALKPVRFITILAGPQFSYLISQKDVFKNARTTIEQEQEFENDNVRKNILCFVGGLDININHVVVGVRAGWDFQNNKGDGTSTTPRYKNVWLQGTLGFRF
jgi:hypothetical protein